MSTSTRSAVFIDGRVSQVECLLANALPQVEVVVLSPDADGVAQITQHLQRQPEVEVVHILAHGAPGRLELGNGTLELANLPRHSANVQQWFARATAPSLFIYGCNVAAGDAGAEFLQQLQQLTGASIAASTRKVGHADLGGSWGLDVELGQIASAFPFAATLPATYAGVFANELFIVVADNESQDQNGVPDGDFNVLVGDDGPLAPIEFDIFTDVEATSNSFLILEVFDVDTNPPGNLLPELDRVSINGVEVGFLEGENDLDFYTVIPIDDLSILNTGENFIEIEVDLNNQNWQASISEAILLINYELGSSLGNADLDSIFTDETGYEPGETVEITAEIDTNLASQDLRIEAILRDPDGNAVDFDDRGSSADFTITGNAVDPFSWQTILPEDATPGTWSIDITVFDADTGAFQFLQTETFEVGPASTPGEVNPHSNFNGDGSADIVWRNTTTGENFTWLLDAGSPIGFGSILSELNFEWVIEGVGDFDGDGREDDLVWYNSTSGQSYIWLTEDDGGQPIITGASDTGILPAEGWQLAGVGDFDGDGFQDDLIWQRPETAEVYIWYLDGGTVVGGGDLSQGADIDAAWHIGGVTSFDGDGIQDDVLWQNTITGEVAIWSTEGNQVVGYTVINVLDDLNWKIQGASDFDNDGNADDILWQNDVLGQVLIWNMDGAAISSFTTVTESVSSDFSVVV